MKCNELTNFDVQGVRIPAEHGKGEFVKRADVDAAIAELKDENRRLKRALWLARAERAKEMCQRLLIQGFDPKWKEVERKCRAKAEEYYK